DRDLITKIRKPSITLHHYPSPFWLLAGGAWKCRGVSWCFGDCIMKCMRWEGFCRGRHKVSGSSFKARRRHQPPDSPLQMRDKSLHDLAGLAESRQQELEFVRNRGAKRPDDQPVGNKTLSREGVNDRNPQRLHHQPTGRMRVGNGCSMP